MSIRSNLTYDWNEFVCSLLTILGALNELDPFEADGM